jgi:hypothetical protein
MYHIEKDEDENDSNCYRVPTLKCLNAKIAYSQETLRLSMTNILSNQTNKLKNLEHRIDEIQKLLLEENKEDGSNNSHSVIISENLPEILEVCNMAIETWLHDITLKMPQENATQIKFWSEKIMFYMGLEFSKKYLPEG